MQGGPFEASVPVGRDQVWKDGDLNSCMQSEDAVKLACQLQGKSTALTPGMYADVAWAWIRGDLYTIVETDSTDPNGIRSMCLQAQWYRKVRAY